MYDRWRKDGAHSKEQLKSATSVKEWLKRMYLCKDTTMLMRWYKEGICENKNQDIRCIRQDGDAYKALDNFDPKFGKLHMLEPKL
ncbi:hypothetical protein BS78_08G077000 [Paspalum vaginatum]|nr:hypothetical protein BS78_08G077000 [Paspalum vaginatum]